MKDFDTIVIGSGVGGLATALCLARAGQRVLVLEQHYVPGGWSHSFTLNKQRFSPGVHYLGLLNKGDALNKLYCGLGIANDLVFFRMNAKAYEHACIGDETFDFPAGVDNLEASLSARFPEEKKNIKKYLTLIQRVSYELQLMPKLQGFWQHLTVPFRTKHFGKFALFPLKKVIGWHIKDPLLKAVLNIQCGDHGLPPKRACFPVHCSVMSHYLGGGFYPMGGGAAIVKAMTNGFKKQGGELRVKQTVSHIIVQNKKATGVQLQDGTILNAQTIVSNADPTTTYLKLVGQEHLSKGLSEKLNKTKYSVTSLILFLTLDLDVTQFGIDSGNFWIMKDENDDANFDQLMTTDCAEGHSFPAIFLSCTTLKDPVSFDGRYHNFEVVTYVDYNLLSCFENLDDYHTNPDYLDFKQKVINKFMNTIEKKIPGAKAHCVQAALGTPKTNEFFIQSTQGNVYGTEKTLNQVGPFSYKNKTEIDNLFLCGASTLSHGVSGATHSGLAAAAAILNCKMDDLIIEDKNQAIRIYDAEDPTTWPDWVQTKRNHKAQKSHN